MYEFEPPQTVERMHLATLHSVSHAELTIQLLIAKELKKQKKRKKKNNTYPIN